MESFYLVQDGCQLKDYQHFVERNEEEIQAYIQFLKEEYMLEKLPEAIIWSDNKGATEIVHKIPVPAYTNDVRMVMTPDVEVWKEIYFHQLDDYQDNEKISFIRQHYQRLSENFILKIVGHELTH